MILIVDHQDSFTRNLEHLLANFDRVAVIDRKEINQRKLRKLSLLFSLQVLGNPMIIQKQKISTEK
jgi:anthranilate/para-aminobenzoate synthase component II